MQNNTIEELVRFFRNIDFDKLINYVGQSLDYIKKHANKGSMETTRMMLELYFVMMNDNTSKLNKLIIGAALAYQFLPNDFFPKEDYGALGYLDNAAALYLAYTRMKKSVTPEIKQKVNDTLAEWAKSASEFTLLKPEDERV